MELILQPFTGTEIVGEKNVGDIAHLSDVHGNQVTMDKLEFERQLDHLILWIEEWPHKQRCTILEELMTLSNFNQFSFLYTTLLPTLHRDFMYTSKQDFPQNKFTPISTPVTRTTKARRCLKKYHRLQSAHLQYRNDIVQCNSELVYSNDVSVKPSQQTHNYKSRWDLPGLSKSTSKLPTIHRGLPMNRRKATHELCQSAPAGRVRIDTLPSIRRHVQETQTTDGVHGKKVLYEPVIKEESPRLVKSMSEIQISRTRSSLSGTCAKQLEPVISKPKEAWQLFHWYTGYWTDVQRNEFLHLLLKRLDARQLYFVSSILTLKKYRDFLTLLPENIAFRILHYLDPKYLLIATRVSQAWNKLASHNKVWKAKCYRINIEVPIPKDVVRWKVVYRDNKFLKRNWSSGHCKEIDLKGHSAKVLCVTCDGVNRVASGSKDTTIKVWETTTGQLLQTLKGHTKGVWCLQFFTTNLLISGSYDNTIKVWNLRTGTCSRTMYGHEGAVWALVRKNNLLVSGSQDKTAKLWHIGRCTLLHTLTGHAQAVFCVDMDNDCKIIITGSADRSIRIWSTETGRHTKVIWASQTTSIMSISYHRGYIACSVGEVISLWRLDTAVCVATFDEHEKRVESLNLRIDNTSDRDKPKGLLVSAGQDGKIKYWNLLKAKSKQTLRGHSKPVNCIVCDNTKIISASFDNKIRVWDFNTVT